MAKKNQAAQETVSRIGRPPKSKEEKFTTPMRQFRMGDEDWSVVVEAAKKAGMTNSDFLRTAALEKAKGR